MRVSSFVRSLLLSVLLLFLFAGWGGTAHRMINLNAPAHLPVSMAGFASRALIFADSASNADNRKSKDPSESPKHFIDIDIYPEFATKTVPHTLDSMILKYGSTAVYANGILPWATVAAVDSLTAQMRRGDWNRVWSTTADLGHYVADAYQPLHCTQNYNGQLTGNTGIHSRHESNMINSFQASITFQTSSVSYITRPMDFVFDVIYHSQSFVDSILAADTYAKLQSGGSTSSTTYYSALWQKTGPFTQALIQDASVTMASLLYTAWVNAGQPVVPSVTSVNEPSNVPALSRLEEAYPNPCNPRATVRFELSEPSEVRLRAFDISGREVQTLAEGARTAGIHSVVFDGGSLASGIYFLRFDARPHSTNSAAVREIKKLILLK